MAKTKKPRLGRGLNSLIAAPVAVQPPERTPHDGPPAGDAQRSPGAPDAAASAQATQAEARDSTAMRWIPIDSIEPNPYQPRRAFSEQALRELAESIRQEGVMQPIIVRRRPDALSRRAAPTPDASDAPGAPDRPDAPQAADAAATATPVYQLVAGERRWRAARLAGLDRLPVLVRKLDDRQLAEWAVIENLQREDLNPIEQAEAFAGLIDRFGLSHQDVAERVGVSRSAVTNTLRLLDLHDEVRELVRTGTLSPGHGRSLLGISEDADQVALAKRAVATGWSVRMVEEAVRSRGEPAGARQRSGGGAGRSAHLSDLEQQLASQLQTKVKIRAGRKKNSGTLSIEFYDLDHFDGLLDKLGVRVE